MRSVCRTQDQLQAPQGGLTALFNPAAGEAGHAVGREDPHRLDVFALINPAENSARLSSWPSLRPGIWRTCTWAWPARDTSSPYQEGGLAPVPSARAGRVGSRGLPKTLTGHPMAWSAHLPRLGSSNPFHPFGPQNKSSQETPQQHRARVPLSRLCRAADPGLPGWS